MVGLRTGLKASPRVGLAVGLAADELSAGGGGAPVLLSIDVTPDDPTMAFADGAVQFTATGTYDIGGPQDLTATAVWASGDTNVATVDASGLVTPVHAGTSAITATVGAIVGTSTPTVTVALASINVTPDATTWRPTASTDRQQMTATGTNDDGSSAGDITASVTWTSGTPTVGTISNGAGTEGQVTPLLVGSTLITATSGAISGNETLTIAVNVDATSGKGVPSTAFQWTMLGVTIASGWLAQEASGNLAGFGPSSFTLTANATPLYQQAVAGWTRTASAFNQTVGQRFAAAAATGPDPSATSVLWIGYMVGQTAPGGARGLIHAGGNVAIGFINGSNALRVACVGVNTDETTTRPDLDDLVHPIVLKYDRTNSAVVLYTDEAKTAGTFNSGATDGLKGFGAGALLTASPPALAGVLYGAVCSGAHAELSDATIKALLQALNWTIPWT